MQEIIVGVEGMMCGKCEAHVNEAVKNTFSVKKVTSSSKENQTVILTEQDITEEQMKEVIEKAGYTMTSFEKGESKKKGFSCFF